MKQTKKLNREHKILLDRRKKNPNEWRLKSETTDEVIFINIETHEELVVNYNK